MKRKRKKLVKHRKVSFKKLLSKAIVKQVLFLFILTVFFFGINSYNNLAIQKRLQNILLPTQANGLPVRLKIPKISVDTSIQYVGLTSQNAMGVPDNGTDVAWLKLGPKPGDKGSAVIDGHVDTETGGKGVFNDLHALAKGDKVFVENDQGKSIPFIVQNSRTYYEGTYVPNVFSQKEGVHLNLITCDGVWDGVKKSYTQRLVVFADAEK